MRILSINNSADTYGASQCLLKVLALFVRDGHKVHVVLPVEGPLARVMREHGVTVHIFRSLAIIDRTQLGSALGKLAFLFRFPYSVLWLMSLIMRLDIDVVHTNTAVIPAPALAAKLTGRRHLWHLREFFSEFPSIWRVYQYYMARYSTQVVTISKAVQAQFDHSIQQHCRLIYDGLDQAATDIDLEAAHNFRRSFGNPDQVIGVVGRIKWVRKGQEVLIKAASILRDKYPKARYVIVGEVAEGNEDHLTRLKGLIRSLGLEDRVIFAGGVNNTRDIYAAFDVSVVPSVQPEPFGCVVMESMAAGTPVVGSRCGGISEQIIDHVTGMLFTPGDEQDLAHCLDQLLADEPLRRAIRDAALKYVSENFTMQETYDRMLHLFSGGIAGDQMSPSVR